MNKIKIIMIIFTYMVYKLSTLIYNGTYLTCSDNNNYVQCLLDLLIYTQYYYFSLIILNLVENRN